MNKNKLKAMIATCILMFAICLSASAKDKKTVERGMTKQEVIAILGKPKITSFDTYGDKWEYRKFYGGMGPESTMNIAVIFDRNEKVVSYTTTLVKGEDRNIATYPQITTPPPYDNGYYPDAGMNYGYRLSDHAFSILYDKVKNTSFDDNKFDLIEVASLGCCYSCAQVSRIISIFSFTDKRLKALQMMVSRIIDPQNAIDIYTQFTFDSDKRKAAEIIRASR